MLLRGYAGALWIIVFHWTWRVLKLPTHLRAPEVGSILKAAGTSPPRLTAMTLGEEETQHRWDLTPLGPSGGKRPLILPGWKRAVP